MVNSPPEDRASRPSVVDNPCIIQVYPLSSGVSVTLLFAAGGGLDSQKLRRLLRSKCFAESEAAPTAEDMAGQWAARDGQWQVCMYVRTIDARWRDGRHPPHFLSCTAPPLFTRALPPPPPPPLPSR